MDHVQLNSNSNLIVPSLSLLILVLSCYVIVRKLWSGRKYGGLVLPPSPPGLPIIGNLHQFIRGHHHRTLQTLAQRHGLLFLIHLGSVPTVVVSSATMAEAVFKTQDNVFCSRPAQYMARRLLWDCRNVGFSAYGQRRIAVVHLLSAKRVESFHALREEEVASLVSQIRAAASHHDNEKQGINNVSELVISLTQIVISRAAFGNKLGGMEPLVIHAMFKEFFDMLQVIAVSDLFPRLGWMDWATGLEKKAERVTRKLDDVLENVLQEHEKGGPNEHERGHLLDDLLLVYREGSSGFKLDREDVKGLIFDIFIAGVVGVVPNYFKIIGQASDEVERRPVTGRLGPET